VIFVTGVPQLATVSRKTRLALWSGDNQDVVIKACRDCGGTGRLGIYRCSTCGGSGQVVTLVHRKR
jgi:hypothetical protein